MTTAVGNVASHRHPDGPRIEIVPTAAALDARAAEIVIDAVTDGSAGTIALPTGSTPIGLYRLMREAVASERLSMDGVVVFQLDEFRNLLSDDPNSFAVWLRAQVLEAAEVSDDRFHLVPATAMDPDTAGQAFETLIDRGGGLDLAVLGLGDNGHVAFNEPGSTAESRTRLLTLSDETVAQTARSWPAGSDVPREAVTMGVGTLLEAKAILLLVKGAAKAGVVRRVLVDEPSADAPGSFMRLAGGRLTVVLDVAAAAAITDELQRWEVVAPTV